jgi:hypothetical protein
VGRDTVLKDIAQNGNPSFNSDGTFTDTAFEGHTGSGSFEWLISDGFTTVTKTVFLEVA